MMSRCYPYPPPGYEKEAHKLTDLAPPITKKERHKHKDKKKKKKKEKEKEKEKAGDLNGESHGKFALDLVSLSFLLLPPSLPPSFHPKNTAVGLLQNLECPVKRFKVYYGPPTIIRLSL
jgi:hypothetical protein